MLGCTGGAKRKLAEEGGEAEGGSAEGCGEEGVGERIEIGQKRGWKHRRGRGGAGGGLRGNGHEGGGGGGGGGENGCHWGVEEEGEWGGE